MFATSMYHINSCFNLFAGFCQAEKAKMSFEGETRERAVLTARGDLPART